MDRVPNARIRELYGVKKGLDERIDQGVLQWREWRGIGLLREYVGECAGSHSVAKPRKRWTDTMKECLKNGGLDIRQTKRMVQDRSE